MNPRTILQKAMINLPNGFTKKLGTTTLLTKKHSPVILFGAGVIGFGATVVLACRATLKVEPLVEETQKKIQNLGADEAQTDKAKKQELRVIRTTMAVETVKLYAPPVLIGLASVCALTGSHVIMTKRNAALAAAVAAVEKYLVEYQKRVINEIGEEKERDIRNGYSTKEFVRETEDGPVVETGKKRTGAPGVYSFLFDEYNHNWQKSDGYNMMFLSSHQVHANNLLHSRGYVFLNEVLKAIGVKPCEMGQLVGWIDKGDGDGFIDFGIFRDDEHMGQEFVNGNERSVWLNFNCDGNILKKAEFTN